MGTLRPGIEDRLLTAGEAAAVLRIKPHTLANWRSRRKGPVVTVIGGTPLYLESDLSGFILMARRPSGGMGGVEGVFDALHELGN